MIRNASIASVLALYGLVGVGAALGDVIDNLPGATCVGAGTVLSPNVAGQIENKGASSAEAICPSERVTVSASLTTKYRAIVWVSDQHPTLDVCCRAVATLPNGVEQQSDVVCSSGTNSNAQLNLTEISMPYTFAHYFVRCALPPIASGKTSRILTYRSYQR